MEIKVSFFIDNKVLVASKGVKEAMADLNKSMPEGSKIVDPLFQGWQYLDSEKDFGYIQMLMNADAVEVNGAEFRVLMKTLKASLPHELWIYIKPFHSKTKLNYGSNSTVEVAD